MLLECFLLESVIYDFNSSFVYCNIFFFSKWIIFFVSSLKELEKFFIQSFPQYKVYLFSIWTYPQIVDIKYPKGICSPIVAVEDFSGLFEYPSISSNQRFNIRISNVYMAFYLTSYID